MPQGSQSQIRPVQDYAFLQYLMKNGYMKMQQALDILEQLYGQGEPTKLAALMSGFNTSLRNHNMSIEKMLSLVDQQEYIALVNKDGDDSASKLGSTYSQPQRELFEFVLESIALSGESPELGGLLSTVNILNSQGCVLMEQSHGMSPGASFRTKMTKREMEQTLHQLAKDGWLGSNPDYAGYYSIGVRSFMELRRYLMSLPLSENTRKEWTKIL